MLMRYIVNLQGFSVAFVFFHSQLYLAFMLLNDQEYLLEEFN